MTGTTPLGVTTVGNVDTTAHDVITLEETTLAGTSDEKEAKELLACDENMTELETETEAIDLKELGTDEGDIGNGEI